MDGDHSIDFYFSFCYGSRYWLYAAVKLKCLLVTNDEMRDHIFELLGSNFFLKWKERHQVYGSDHLSYEIAICLLYWSLAPPCQVRYTFLRGSPELHMPPPFSIAIQVYFSYTWLAFIPTIVNVCEFIECIYICCLGIRERMVACTCEKWWDRHDESPMDMYF